VNGAPTSDDAAYDRKLKAKVEADAQSLCRGDPRVLRREREIGRIWADLAHPAGIDNEREDLLARAERFAHTDVDAPFGAKPGIREVKRCIRKLVYWYLRYLADQINAWNNTVVRWMRRTDRRLQSLEAATSPWPDTRGRNTLEATGATPLRSDVFAIGDVTPATADAIAAEMLSADGLVAVIGCGEGAAPEALVERNMAVYGVDPSPERIAEGADRGLDLRPGETIEHLTSLDDGILGGVVLIGAATGLPVASTVAVAGQAARVVAAGGVIVVAADDPALLTQPERDLRVGRGVAAETWAYLLGQAGCRVAARRLGGPGPVTELVVARRR